MNDAMRVLYQTGQPARLLIYGEHAPRSVIAVRGTAGGVVIEMAGGRRVTVSEREVWAGVYIARDIVQVRCCDESGTETWARLLDTNPMRGGQERRRRGSLH